MFKTDASLYNGFSGGAIWTDNLPIGMAIFIIKNTTTFNQLYKQNFCYLTSFLFKVFNHSLEEQDNENDLS